MGSQRFGHNLVTEQQLAVQGIKSLSAKAGDTSSILGPGRLLIPQSDLARVP